MKRYVREEQQRGEEMLLKMIRCFEWKAPDDRN
jgi:hypothetical protein